MTNEDIYSYLDTILEDKNELQITSTRSIFKKMIDLSLIDKLSLRNIMIIKRFDSMYKENSLKEKKDQGHIYEIYDKITDEFRINERQIIKIISNRRVYRL